MAQLVNVRENIIQFYQKYGYIIRAVVKFALSFIILYILAQMFDYGSKGNNPLLLAAISLAQAFLPLAVLYFSGSILIMSNLWQLSPDIFAGFALLFLLGCLTLVRVDKKSAWIAMAVPVLFYLKLEYVIPVFLGITVGLWAVVPAAMGVLIYFLSGYTESVSTLLTTTEAAGPAAGLQRIANLIMIDRNLLVIFAAYCTVIIITALLNHLFYERAWLFAIIVGNVVLAVIMLYGRYVFDLDFEVWRVLLEVVLSMLACVTYWFFKGIGDTSRTERTVFEDDEYIYYVKAVPKLKVAQKDHSVRDIHVGEGKETGDDKKPVENKKAETVDDTGANNKKKTPGEKRSAGNKKQADGAGKKPAEDKKQAASSIKAAVDGKTTRVDDPATGINEATGNKAAAGGKLSGDHKSPVKSKAEADDKASGDVEPASGDKVSGDKEPAAGDKASGDKEPAADNIKKETGETKTDRPYGRRRSRSRKDRFPAGKPGNQGKDGEA